MESKTMLVKEESIFQFMKDRQCEEGNSPNVICNGRAVEPCDMLKKEMYLKSPVEPFRDGYFIQFEINDESMKSRQKLISTYVYSIERHDDVSVKAVRTRIDITLISQ